MACTHTHIHTHTCITTARVGYVAPIQGVSQQELGNQTGGPIGSGDTSLISSVAPSLQKGYTSMDLQDP